MLSYKLKHNGAVHTHPNTKVVFEEDYSFTEKISDWWSGKYKDNQSGELIIRDFNINLKDKSGSGKAELNSHKAVIYTGLISFNPTKKSKPIPLWKFVNTAMHELGHAIYGFEHDDEGDTETGVGVMDYDHQFDYEADFDQFQQEAIWLRAHGIDASSGAAKGIIQNGAVIQGAVNGIINTVKSIFKSAAPVREAYRSVRFL
tara:strand:- start:51701 stop:52306 length:606 start_codon:yes stop_codon:yes gene_type:complete